MLPQRRYKLSGLRRKYAYTLSKPTLELFGLKDSLAEEIINFNKDVDSKNGQATNEANLINNKSYRKERNLFYIIFNIIFWPMGGVILYLLNEAGAELGLALLGLALFGAGIPAGLIAITIPEKIWPHKKAILLPHHIKSEDLDKYNQYVADYKLFNELLEEEQRDKEERAKAEYWFSLGGFEFEDEMTNLFTHQGYNATKTQNTGDGGVDIILMDKNMLKTIVQCKAHKKPIGPNDIRALFGVMKADGADGAILINLGGFTQGVKDFAQTNNIVLMDVNDVLELQEKFKN